MTRNRTLTGDDVAGSHTIHPSLETPMRAPRKGDSRIAPHHVAVLLFLMFVGPTQSVAYAADDAQPPATTSRKNDNSAEARTITITVRDTKDMPIEDANVHVSVWAIDPADKRYSNRDFTTNADGVAEIEIPCRLSLLRMWVMKSDYVPQVLCFEEEDDHDDGRLIPDTHAFKLETGHRVSGYVVDVEGKPIAKAKVHVKVNGEYALPDGSPPTPTISGWLANGTDAAITDTNGRWEITNAPGPKEKSDYEFELFVTHPEFVGDTRWGEHQKAQGIITAQLRDGTAKLVLKRGLAISGIISGPDGNPVTKGLVIWNDSPYWAKGDNEVPIDQAGRYQTLRLAPGKYPITVAAPAFAPQRQEVELTTSDQQLDFQLQAGNSIQIQIVDPTGKPVPKAKVYLDGWRGTEALYNVVHPNVLASGIPRNADENGLFTWDWAPADAVGYRISAEGFADHAVTLFVSDEPHRVQLFPAITFFGNVIDAQSAQPVERFRVVPVTELSTDYYSTSFHGADVVVGKNGQYRLQINNQAAVRYFVRIEADGYRTALSQNSIELGDPPLQVDFKLEKVPARIGTVLDPNGEPAKAFNVAVGTPTIPTPFNNALPDTGFGIGFRVTGSHQFKLAATFEPMRTRVYNDSGFAEIVRQPDEEIGTIRLQPWASVTGRLMQADQPMANQGVYFSPLVRRGITEPRFEDSYSTKTDASGYFQFDRLPPESGKVGAWISPWDESELTATQSVPVELRPGDQKEMTLGRYGATVTGRVVATEHDNENLNKNWSLNSLVSRDRGVDFSFTAKSLGFDPSGPIQESWLKQPEFRSWMSTREYFTVKLAEDGRMRITGVPAGEYDLVIQLYEDPKGGCLVEPLGTKVFPLTITSDQVRAGIVELGDLEVPCPFNPPSDSDP